MKANTAPVAIENPALIGTQVVKISGKPFKSGEKVATVKGYTINKQTGNLSFVFEEDDSDVEVHRCISHYVELPDAAFDSLIEAHEVYQNYLNNDCK